MYPVRARSKIVEAVRCGRLQRRSNRLQSARANTVIIVTNTFAHTAKAYTTFVSSDIQNESFYLNLLSSLFFKCCECEKNCRPLVDACSTSSCFFFFFLQIFKYAFVSFAWHLWPFDGVMMALAISRGHGARYQRRWGPIVRHGCHHHYH